MQQDTRAKEIRLASVFGQCLAHLDGFKSHALGAKMPVRRDLYVTVWGGVEMDAMHASNGVVLAIVDDESLECEHMMPRASLSDLTAKLEIGSWSAVAAAVATQRASRAVLPLFALEVALAAVQTQTTLTPVWLLTLGAHGAQSGVVHAGAWGLARSARAEGSISLTCIDAPLNKSLKFTLSEPEVTWHKDKSRVPRLRMAPTLLEGDVRLHFHARGAISNLFIEPQPALPPVEDGMVLLRVRAVGLNFRDVLNVLGEYPGDPGPPGGDVAGVVDDAACVTRPVVGLGHAPLASMALTSSALGRRQAAYAVI